MIEVGAVLLTVFACHVLALLMGRRASTRLHKWAFRSGLIGMALLMTLMLSWSHVIANAIAIAMFGPGVAGLTFFYLLAAVGASALASFVLGVRVWTVRPSARQSKAAHDLR
jgi:hypothetical protein